MRGHFYGDCQRPAVYIASQERTWQLTPPNWMPTRWLASTTGWVVTWTTFVLITVLVISYCFWDWMTGHETGSATIRNLSLGAAAAIGLPLAIWRSRVAERQADAARRQSETAQCGLINERYQKGTEMLGSNVLAVRLGGIFALQRLAFEHESYHVSILLLFCAFVCNPTKLEDGTASTTRSRDEGSPLLRPDVAAVMRAVATRQADRKSLEKDESFRLDFRAANLEGLDFLRIGEVDLSECILIDTNLSHARFPINANLSHIRHAYGANFSHSRLNRVNLEYSNLMDADLSCATMIGANLQCADLRDANLSGAKLTDADLSGAELRGANLSGTNFSLDDHPPARGLTQDQLNVARADESSPPTLDGVVDWVTNEPLIWRGKNMESNLK